MSETAHSAPQKGVSLSNDNAYMNKYMKRRYRYRRQLAFDFLGNVCEECCSLDDLEIDHIDREGVPHSKKFSKFWNMKIDQFYRELHLCQLLCHDCHLKKSIEEMSVEHGGGASGKKNCLCVLCRAQKAVYSKLYNQTHVRKRDR